MPIMNVLICRRNLKPKTRSCMHKALLEGRYTAVNSVDGKIDILLDIDKRIDISIFTMYLSIKAQVMDLYKICNYARTNGYDINFYTFSEFRYNMSSSHPNQIDMYMKFDLNRDKNMYPKDVYINKITPEILELSGLREELYEFVSAKIIS